MVGGAREGARAAARAAYAGRRWADAYDALTVADAADPLGPADLERLAIAAYCTGRSDESARAWAQVYNAHLAAGDFAGAALAAAWCSFGHLNRGEFAMGSGWLRRAQALCQEHDLDCPASGFALCQVAAGAMFGADYAGALALFGEAQRIADRLRDPDGMTLARLGRGQCLTFLGRAREGFPLLDEVMVAITSDDVSPLVVGLAFCAAIECCQQALDVRRAQEWTVALSRWCAEQPDLVPYRGNCLIHRSEILALHGAWAEAYDEAERARRWLADVAAAPVVGSAYYQLGELHRLRGAYRDAESAYEQASQFGRETQPGLGLLRLAQGHVESAAAAIRRALDETTNSTRRPPLLSAQVAVCIAAGDIAGARLAAQQLGEIAAQLDAPVLRAQALHADGAVVLASGEPGAALASLRAAWMLWQELDSPYEGARARVLIGEACRALGDQDSAEMEFDAARWVFQELGAAPELSRLQKLSRSKHMETRGGLSLRELQVLRLVAAGKANRSIADELFLSEKTVHRHVSNIFTKLGVGSRAAATAYAFKNGLV